MRKWELMAICVVLGAAVWASRAVGPREARERTVLAATAQAPLQELIPLPAPGQQFPGSKPQPGDDQCEARVYLFFNGRFYQMQPGPHGTPGAPQELIPLQPVPGPGRPAPGAGSNPFLPVLPPGTRF